LLLLRLYGKTVMASDCADNIEAYAKIFRDSIAVKGMTAADTTCSFTSAHSHIGNCKII
jgi:hypothetical protein